MRLTWKRETWVVALLGRASTASVKMLHVHLPISSGVTFIYAHNTSNNLMRIHHNRRGSIRSSDLLQFDTFHNVPCWLVDFRWWCCPASARRRSTPRSNSWRLDLEFGTSAQESDLFRRKLFHRLVLTWRRWVPLKHVVNKWWRNNNEDLFKPYCQLGPVGRRQSAANETQWVTSEKQPSPQDCWALNNNHRSLCIISCELSTSGWPTGTRLYHVTTIQHPALIKVYVYYVAVIDDEDCQQRDQDLAMGFRIEMVILKQDVD